MKGRNYRFGMFFYRKIVVYTVLIVILLAVLNGSFSVFPQAEAALEDKGEYNNENGNFDDQEITGSKGLSVNLTFSKSETMLLAVIIVIILVITIIIIQYFETRLPKVEEDMEEEEEEAEEEESHPPPKKAKVTEISEDMKAPPKKAKTLMEANEDERDILDPPLSDEEF